jgi:hypothetical protein
VDSRLHDLNFVDLHKPPSGNSKIDLVEIAKAASIRAAKVGTRYIFASACASAPLRTYLTETGRGARSLWEPLRVTGALLPLNRRRPAGVLYSSLGHANLPVKDRVAEKL